MALRLEELVEDVGRAIKRVDATRPRAVNTRTGTPFRPGIGPHSEAKAVELVVSELRRLRPARYETRLQTGVAYPGEPRQRCDLCIGTTPGWDWAIEVKLLRMVGNNGKPNDNMLMHILSPYAKDRSAISDCTKLVTSRLSGRKAILIYGFDYPDLPMDPAIDAFELLARARVTLRDRYVASYVDLVHPVHRYGRVFGWEVEPPQR
jgi:hypothetical protein